MGRNTHMRRPSQPQSTGSQKPPGEHILDIGSGTGVLAPHIARTGATYTGVDTSPQLLEFAKQHHAVHGRFILGDARRLPQLAGIERAGANAAVFLLSLQDMEPLTEVLRAGRRG